MLRAAAVWAFAAYGVAVGQPVPSAGRAKQVLVLYSNGRLLPANIDADRGIRAGFATATIGVVALYDEFLDQPRFSGEVYEQAFATYLREKYASRHIDLVIAAGRTALTFMGKHRGAIFPTAAIVHAGVEDWVLGSTPSLPADVVGVPMRDRFFDTFDLALRLHPRAKHLVAVTGASAQDLMWEGAVRRDAVRLGERATVEFLSGLKHDAVLKRLHELASDSVVFTTGYFQDADGRNFLPRDAAAAMAAASSAPVYVSLQPSMGTGVVGGYMPDFEALGKQAATVACALLAGAAPASLGLPATSTTTLQLDWRQIGRWGIDPGAIPAGAVMHFRQPTFLDQYRREALLFAAALVLQAGLIGVLLIERRRRRRAEEDSQRQRFELAHASRLIVAGELTASIAHEINQPLGAILSNADAADLILEAGTDRRDELQAILADIRRDDLRASDVIRRLRALLARHEVERQPFDLNDVIRELESNVGAEARRRRVTLDIRLSTDVLTLIGDPVHMQQVLLNLVLNALDAVADLPDGRRVVRVAATRDTGTVRITVTDLGRGVAPEHLPKLFESFFTTKRLGMGLGLPIARTLVEAHGGRIWAENGHGPGAVFHVELPVPSSAGAPAREQA